MLHGPGEDAEEQQRIEIAPLTLALEGADIDHAEHDRQNQGVAQRRKLRELAGEDVAQARAKDIGDGDGPDHRISDGEVLRQHVRARDQPVHQEGAEQDRHAGGAGHAEHDGGDERAAFTRAGGAFRRDHAAHVALAEGPLCVLLCLQSVAIGDPVDDRRRNAGDRADDRTNPRTTDVQPEMVEAID